MTPRAALTAFLRRRRSRQAETAAALHATARRRPPAPTTRDVAVGGQTSSTVG